MAAATTPRTAAAAAGVLNEEEVLGIVKVTVVEGKKLPVKDLTGSSDPFVVLSYGPESRRTTTKMKTLNPFWLESFQFIATKNTQSYVLKLECWDWDKVSANDHIGSVEVETASLWQDDGSAEREIELALRSKQGRAAGTLTVRLSRRLRADVEREFWLAAAKQFDSDESGMLSKLELSGMISALEGSMTDAEVDALFAAIDVDHDEHLSYSELCDWARQPGNAEKLTGRPDLVWRLAVHINDSGDAATVLEDVERYLGTPLVAAGQKSEQTFTGSRILVRDRKSGVTVEEKISSALKTAMRVMYGGKAGRSSVSTGQVKKILLHLTEAQGRSYDDPRSKAQIAKFIAFHGINTEEMALGVEDFRTFNEFFFRKLKSGARPIDHASDASVATSPADSRLSAYSTVDDATRIWIKGNTFSLRSMLCDDALAEEFRNCSIVIARLAPQDYHRFHSPCAGTVSAPRNIDGTYYTVNPLAINHDIDVYGENKRSIRTIETSAFGKVVFVAVGATCVGTIVWTNPAEHAVKKGDELGYFAFGGSTVILLFKAGTITLDSDLLANSSKPIETLVRVGYSIGHH